jgi:transcription elongation factor GreA
VTALPPGDRVVFGATVELENQDDGSVVIYQIVGELEADARLSLISITSPIARALVGKNVGDVVDVSVPGGVRAFEIVAVRFG